MNSQILCLHGVTGKNQSIFISGPQSQRTGPTPMDWCPNKRENCIQAQREKSLAMMQAEIGGRYLQPKNVRHSQQSQEPGKEAQNRCLLSL